MQAKPNNANQTKQCQPNQIIHKQRKPKLIVQSKPNNAKLAKYCQSKQTIPTEPSITNKTRQINQLQHNS